MNALLDFFVAGPARVKGLLLGAMALGLVCLSLTTWALLERVSASQARMEAVRAVAERDRAIDQVAIVAATAKACSASVDHAHKVGETAIEATSELRDAAKRISAPAVHTVERIEKILQQPAPPGGGCDQAWDKIEADRKAGAL